MSEVTAENDVPEREPGAHTGCGDCGARVARGEPHKPDCPRVTLPGHRLIGPMTDSTDPRWHCVCGEEISRSGWTADLNFAEHLTRVTSPASTTDKRNDEETP